MLSNYSKLGLLRQFFYNYRKPLIIFGFLVFVFIGLNLAFPLNKLPEFSPIVTDNKGNVIGAYLSPDDKWRFKTHLNEVSPFMVKAIIEKEDKYFYYHPGINLVAIIRAGFSNLLKRKRVSGASTITMQVARMINPQPRTLRNKIFEALRAIQLEFHYSKKEILELYLSLLPYGSNIEGVKSASYLLLQKHPLRLSLAEAMVFTIIPNKPSIMNSYHSLQLKEYKNRWLNFFEQKKMFDKKEIDLARSETVHFLRKPITNLAPHLSRRLVQDPEKSIITSTIDVILQKQIDQLSINYLERIKNEGIKNAMILVVDNKTMEVKAYMGSADYKGTDDAGQVDGIQSIRSPGSTLKPYLYALAFENGLINPKSKLLDIPSDFHGFVPENFDNQYRGEISVSEALQQSLNIPAVDILDKLSVGQFINALKKGGFSNIIKNEDQLGLSVILGGCGVKMEEMVRLYASFANHGTLQDLIFSKNQSSGSKVKLLDSASVFMISQILSGVQRPDFPNNFEFTFRLPLIAWKTGTSFGKRDAWAIGYNPDYTVGVWLGNFSGESIPQLSGASVATPLLFQVFNLLPYTTRWFNKPSNLIYRSVCTVSGLPANAFCKNISTDTFVKGVIQKQKCQHLKMLMVNLTETMSYCGKCADNHDIKNVYYPNLDPRYIGYLKTKSLGDSVIPPHNNKCITQRLSNDLTIISPRNKGIYYIDGKQEIELSAQSSNSNQDLIWYHNNRQIGTIKASKSLFITPIKGRNTISCTDPSGKTVTIWFEGKTF